MDWVYKALFFISHTGISVVILVITIVVDRLHDTLTGEVPSPLKHVLMFINGHNYSVMICER